MDPTCGEVLPFIPVQKAQKMQYEPSILVNFMVGVRANTSMLNRAVSNESH